MSQPPRPPAPPQLRNLVDEAIKSLKKNNPRQCLHIIGGIHVNDQDPESVNINRLRAIASTLIAAQNNPSNLNAILSIPPDCDNFQLIEYQHRRLHNLLNPAQNQYPFASKAFDLINQAFDLILFSQIQIHEEIKHQMTPERMLMATAIKYLTRREFRKCAEFVVAARKVNPDVGFRRGNQLIAILNTLNAAEKQKGNISNWYAILGLETNSPSSEVMSKHRLLAGMLAGNLLPLAEEADALVRQAFLQIQGNVNKVQGRCIYCPAKFPLTGVLDKCPNCKAPFFKNDENDPGKMLWRISSGCRGCSRFGDAADLSNSFGDASDLSNSLCLICRDRGYILAYAEEKGAPLAIARDGDDESVGVVMGQENVENANAGGDDKSGGIGLMCYGCSDKFKQLDLQEFTQCKKCKKMLNTNDAVDLYLRKEKEEKDKSVAGAVKSMGQENVGNDKSVGGVVKPIGQENKQSIGVVVKPMGQEDVEDASAANINDEMNVPPKKPRLQD